MENKKYKLVKDDFIIHEGKKLYRIKALRSIYADSKKSILRVRQGDLGGYVEKYCNLSQEGSCWIYGNAKVYSNSEVRDSSRIFSGVIISGNVRIKGSSTISGDSNICGNAIIFDSSITSSRISGNVVLDSVGMTDTIMDSNSTVIGKHYIHYSNLTDNSKIAITFGSNSSQKSIKFLSLSGNSTLLEMFNRDLILEDLAYEVLEDGQGKSVIYRGENNSRSIKLK